MGLRPLFWWVIITLQFPVSKCGRLCQLGLLNKKFVIGASQICLIRMCREEDGGKAGLRQRTAMYAWNPKLFEPKYLYLINPELNLNHLGVLWGEERRGGWRLGEKSENATCITSVTKCLKLHQKKYICRCCCFSFRKGFDRWRKQSWVKPSWYGGVPLGFSDNKM